MLSRNQFFPLFSVLILWIRAAGTSNRRKYDKSSAYHYKVVKVFTAHAPKQFHFINLVACNWHFLALVTVTVRFSTHTKSREATELNNESCAPWILVVQTYSSIISVSINTHPTKLFNENKSPNAVLMYFIFRFGL